MSGSNAASATAAMHDIDTPHSHGFWSPSLLSLAVILATIAVGIWIISKDDDDDLDFDNIPISPN